MMVIMLSLMSGALLHAYAGSSDHQTAAAVTGPSMTTQVTSLSAKMTVQETVDVCPGDTLWDIASSHLPKGENVRSYMNKIKKANNLKNTDLRAGQILILP
ncbi:LysM peptidoglycan-binding domain-containing protein [Gorillibacterium sp. sgz5001074]|uniref:LysM peptidoglycan-binding domain-containing protein n=1 Tax=Gorillibacterium sp. sgz5001074 TaxID=3446695 RepID=UPI003F678FC5